MMVLPSDQIPPQQDYLLRRIDALERQVRELAAGRRLEASSVGEGGVTIRGGGLLHVEHINGVGLLDVGPGVTSANEPIEQILAYRPDGSPIFWIWGRNSSDLGFLAVYDRGGNILFADDPVAEQGLSKPYFPCGSFVSMASPTEFVTSGTFTLKQKCVWRKQHPRIRIVLLHNVTSTTAEFRWRIANGPDVDTLLGGAAVSVGTGSSWGYYGPFDVPGAHLSEFEIDLEVRVASGAGGIDVETLHTIGMQA